MLTIAKLNKFHLWVHLQQTYDLIHGCEDDFHLKSNITREQFSILWNINYISEIRKKPVILSDLVSISLRNKNTLSEIVNRMEKLGLIKKIKDLPDRRMVHLVITPKGGKIFSKNALPNLKLVDRIFSAFDDREVKTMLMLVKKLRKWIWQNFQNDKSRQDSSIDNPANIDNFLDKLL